MKIFAVYTKIKLTKKPSWLDSFRSRYDKPYEYHVTLKQPCLIRNNQVPEIKTKLYDLFSSLKIKNHRISMIFDSLRVDKDTPNDICIMIDARKIDEIKKLQKDVLLTLSKYSRYDKIKRRKYEKNFKPHITISRDLTQKSYLTASKYLEQDYTCKGIITEVVLGVVNNLNVTESNNPNNQTVYKL